MSKFGQAPVGQVIAPCPLQKATHWIEIEVFGADDSPMPYLAYRLTLPDGGVQEGYLDASGFARVEGVEPSGSCQVCFPELDKDNWTFVKTLPARHATS